MSEGTFFPITDASFGSELSPEAFDMLAGQYLASLGPNEAVVRPDWNQSKEVRRRKFLAALVAGVQAGLAGGSGGAAQIFAGEPNPNGYQTATGPAVYLQSDTSPPTEWFKVTPGTSNNEWVSASGSGGFVSIYSGASVTPEAAQWQVLDGRVTQQGLGVRATTGTTAITTGAGLTFDGAFNLSPIGSTLATFISQGCTFSEFAPGTLANLTVANLSGSSFGVLDLSGCLNALVLTVNGEISTSFVTPASLHRVTIGAVDSPGRYFPPTNFSGSDLYQLTVNNVDFTAGFNITGCTSLVSAAIGVCTFSALSFSGCSALQTLLLNGSTFPQLDVSANAALETLSLTGATFTSASVAGSTSIRSVVTGDAVFTQLNASGSSIQTYQGGFTGMPAGTPQSINLSGALSLTNVTYVGPGAPGISGAVLNASGCSALTTVDLYGAALSSVNLSGCSSLSAVTSAYSTGSYSLNLANCVSLASLSGSSVPTPEIASLDLSGCTGLAGVGLASVTTLTTVTATTLPAATSIDFSGCALTAASVNAILVAIDSGGQPTGAVNVSGGTNAAPTGPGIAAKNSLVSKGWLVMTN